MEWRLGSGHNGLRTVLLDRSEQMRIFKIQAFPKTDEQVLLVENKNSESECNAFQ